MSKLEKITVTLTVVANYHSKGGRRNNNDSLVNSTTLLHLNGPPPHNTQAFSLLLIVSLLPLSLSLSTTMAEPHSAANPPPPPSSSSAGNRDSAGDLPSSSSTFRHGSEDENAGDRSQTGFRSPEVEPSVAYGGGGGIGWGLGVETSVAREDAWSCLAVIFTFWFFVSVTMILGVYGSMNLVLGPETSIVFKPSPLFVQYVKVENLKENPGPILYGTYQYPDLDVATTWEETLSASIPSDSHQEWKYYLNGGSEVNISYRLSSGSSSIFLVIAEGIEGLTQWLEDPTYPNTTLSWNEIHGTGMITQKIPRSSSYYVALGNLDEEVQVELYLTVRAYLHNTTNAYYKCAVTSSPCSLSIFFPEGNAAILVTPGPQQNASYDEWYVKLSYGPRWVTYIVGIGGLTLLMVWGFNILNKIHCAREHIPGVRYEGTAPERDPLLSRKDDDLSSWGSSYDSMPQDEEDLDLLTAGSTDGKSLVDGETSNNTRRLCAICFDAPRDCFFLPCGHCAACFECGTRIAEAAGTCPVCRRNMKKVRKIFTV